MKCEDIKQITVIGSGTMGNGICHQFALGGYKVDMVDMNQAILDRAIETIRKNMDRQVKKETISQDQMNAALANIRVTTDLFAAKSSQVVIEAVYEDLDVKLEIFQKLDILCHPETILATSAADTYYWPPPAAALSPSTSSSRLGDLLLSRNPAARARKGFAELQSRASEPVRSNRLALTTTSRRR